jgi:hypothetical protein
LALAHFGDFPIAVTRGLWSAARKTICSEQTLIDIHHRNLVAELQPCAEIGGDCGGSPSNGDLVCPVY